MELLMFLSQLPASPSSLRVMVWRRMKSAGALGLQNGVWILPGTSEHEGFLQELMQYVEDQGGSGQIFIVKPGGEAIEQDILRRFRLEREREYDEFKEQYQEFMNEIEKETARKKFSFAELEENEQNFQKLSGWLSKIQKRDFFGTEQTATAIADLEKCRQTLDAFANQVYAQDGMDTAGGISLLGK